MSRCLLVSNRLPIAWNKNSQEFVATSGGLVSAIKGLDSSRVGHHFEWMGIMTDDIQDEQLNQLRDSQLGDFKCHPIIVPKEMYDTYYNVYCNNVLWPLFHYERSIVQSELGWESYYNINERVAEAILKEAQDDDMIWIHDFHFLLVSGFIKKKKPHLKVGFFLHIPFPSSEIFREIPQRKELLHSLLQCDLVGFHDLSYLSHFKSSIQRILGENTSQNDRNWGVYPISIDTEHFINLTKELRTKEFLTQFRENKKEMKWILGVDRLDYIKGLVLKLKTFKEFLKAYPEERGNVQLVQVVIPSRTDVPEYQNLKNTMEQLISSINGEFGTPTYTPISYLYHSVSEYELSALYQLSELMYIGSRRDGMNLVSLEYVVSQNLDRPGALLLSEFTGAHSTLSYAFSINPWNIEETSKKIKLALHHPLDERRHEMMSMQNFLKNYNSSDWARVFLHDLRKDDVMTENKVTFKNDHHFPWMNNLNGKKITIFCDFDGTLAPIASHPSLVKINPQTISLLKKIANHKYVELIIISGRDKDFLHEHFVNQDLNVGLVACHGAYTYSQEEKKWKDLIPHDTTKWKEKVIDIFKLYSLRTPESFIEDKGHAVTWHYRNAPTEFAEFLANKLYIELEESLSSQPVEVIRGKKVIEVKSLHANKGIFVQQWLQNPEHNPETVIALGDDTTDEEMFEALQDRIEVPSFCIKVGKEKSHAKYTIKEQQQVNLFLDQLIDQSGL